MHCRHCGRTTTPPRRTFCSDACVHAYRLSTSMSYARSVIFKRDNGVCLICGLDTLNRKAVIAKANELGRSIPKHRKSFWDTHHEVAVADNGQNSIRNLKTLCLFCHQDATEEQRVDKDESFYGWDEFMCDNLN